MKLNSSKMGTVGANDSFLRVSQNRHHSNHLGKTPIIEFGLKLPGLTVLCYTQKRHLNDSRRDCDILHVHIHNGLLDESMLWNSKHMYQVCLRLLLALIHSHSTVTDFAKFLGKSTSSPLLTANQ